MANAQQIDTKLQNGDIIFQSTVSMQAQAIKQATHSQYSHCGMVLFENNKCYVLEAVQPVKQTPIEEFAARSDGHYVVKRLKDQQILNSNFTRLKNNASEYLGRNYDLFFSWDDRRIYCSELIWKSFHKSLNIDLGKLQQLKEMDLSSPLVKAILKQRYGEQIPYNDTVISPASIFESPLLETVLEK